ncbi:hypothetical protein UlMin_026655 [Ulmus minor]
MKLEVEVISKEIIKPSSPTPNNLRHYQLSFLDQLSPKVYNPLVLFYPSLNVNGESNNITEISIHLKNSLSKVLTLYYPLAGRVRNDEFVECNDEGIPFFEARAKGQLISDVIENPIPQELINFLPFELDEVSEFALGVQLNVFECGGIAIGVCLSHQLGDALSSIVFNKTWVAIARGEAEVAPPIFASAALFPLRKEPYWFNPNSNITKKGITTKRFVFSSSTIEALRKKYEKSTCLEENEKRPSRVEALSTFIWSRILLATNDIEDGGVEKCYVIVHPVNIRPKLDPSLPENSFGNLYRAAITTIPFSSVVNEEKCVNGLVKMLREGIRKVDKEYIEKVKLGEEAHMDFLKENATNVAMRGGEVITVGFTSLCRFPLYEADFGWGKPAWVSSASFVYQNIVAFLDTKMGEGIEAYISLKEDLMAKIEADKEFLESVSSVEC